MLGLGWGEMLVLLAIVLIIFGASRLPEIGKGLGSGIQEFKKSVKGEPEPNEKIESEEKKKELPE